MYPYIPAAADAIESFESKFEQFAAMNNYPVDLDLDLVATYKNPRKALSYDITEIDLCIIDSLATNGLLDDISSIHNPAKAKGLIGPAAQAVNAGWARFVVPHWVCGNFLVNWADDHKLSAANTFEELLGALDPASGRFLYADLGGGTLGELYVDAVIDIYGAEDARTHLKSLANLATNAVPELRANAVAAIRRLIQELDPKHKKQRDVLHDLTHVFPASFADEPDAALIGYSERLYYVEVRFQDQPWKATKRPLPTDSIRVRAIPFANRSGGTPTWVDAFVVPKGRLKQNRRAMELFFEFALSEQGYKALYEPIEDYPRSYLLPAYSSVLESPFIETHMPLLKVYARAFDESFPMIEQELYLGMTRAAEALAGVLKTD
jgi:hypothetical protein